MSPKVSSRLIVVSIALCIGLLQIVPKAQSGAGAPKPKVRLNQIMPAHSDTPVSRS